MYKLFLVGTVLANTTSVTPVQKVVELLSGMLEAGKKEKHEEQVQYAAFSQWCDDTTSQRQEAIKAANEKIETLTANIEKYGADAARLGREVQEHSNQVAGWNADIQAGNDVREKENSDFKKTETDYGESISALERAVDVLKSQSHDRKQAKSALLQISDLIPAREKPVIEAFLARGDDDAGHLAVAAPDANAYEFQSGGVVDMLQKLLDQFEQEITTLRTEESNAKHAHQMLVQDLRGQIAEGERQVEEKSAAKATNEQNKANAEADKNDTTVARDADQAFLDDTTAECAKKASDFEKRQELRADEIKAVETAIEILSSDSVAGTADRHLPQLVQQATSLLQLRARKQPKLAQSRVVIYLKEQADKYNSRMLSTLAVRVAEDPFVKVRQMIQDLITRLMEEANAEAEEKGWCDEEVTSNKQTRDEKSAKIEKLMAEKDRLEASIAKRTSDINELTTQIAELDKVVAEAKAIRSTDKATNTQTIKEAKEAQTAVARALKVLQEFYAKGAVATSLVQKPPIFDRPYQGQQGESTGVIGMLEVIQSDFARLEADTTAEEGQAQREHDDFLDASAVDKADKSAQLDHENSRKEKEEKRLVNTNSDLQGTQKELDAALKYYESIKPRCVDSGVSYEDRVARRQEEIESLQEALRILNGEDLA